MTHPDPAVAAAPFADLAFAPAAVEAIRRGDGSLLLRSPQKLGDYPKTMGAILEHQGRIHGERVFLAERGADGAWRRITFAQTLEKIRRLGQALLDRGAGVQRPVAILSGNAIDHALLTLAAMHIGAPAAPISVAYSLMSQDFAKLKHCLRVVTPAVIFVDNGAPFAKALQALQLEGLLADARLVVGANPPPGIAAEPLATLLATTPTAAVDRAFAATGPDSVAKVLFTSGSTGLPKGVINTQRMLCSNQQAMTQVYRFLDGGKAPSILDWLPWNHTFGGNHDFNMMLFHGGTLYIDGGKPAPGAIEQTIANLREISPSIYFNVPRGFDMIIPYLERDADLRDNFFKNLDLIFYAAAALPQNLWERLEALSVQSLGRKVTMISAWGSTETAPCATAVHWRIERAGVIGLPIPGTELLMTPTGTKLELRVRGANVTPGYWRAPDLTKAAFDQEGFYRIGDAGKLLDPDDPAKGVVFDGRVAEDFKLMSGTWVHSGALRVAAIGAGAPLIQDCVVAGHDREEVALLIFLNQAACAGQSANDIQAALTRSLSAYNQQNPANSTRIARALILHEPPSIDANEITDKGYINQRAVLENRRVMVERLYAASADADVIVPA